MKEVSKYVFDWELLRMIGAGSKEAWWLLLRRYDETARRLIGHYRNQKGMLKYTCEDLHFLYLDALYKAVGHYHFNIVTFKSFFLQVINRDLNNFFNAEIRSKDAMGHAISLDEQLFAEQSLYEVIPDGNAVDPKRDYDLKSARLCLSGRYRYQGEKEVQRKMLLMRINGRSYREIASLTGYDISKVRRILHADEEGTPLRDIRIRLIS